MKEALGVESGKVLFGGCASEMVEKIFKADEESWRIGSPYEHDCIYKRLDEVETNVAKFTDWASYYNIYCHQLVNNVIGAIFDLKPYGNWAKEDDHHIFLCDLTASIGKVKLPNLEELGVDIALWSGHKLGTEKNLGCAWFSDKALKWLGEDFKLQLGTPNVEGAIAVAEASWDAVKKIEDSWHHYYILQDKLYSDLQSEGFFENWAKDFNEEEVKKWSCGQPIGTPAINALYLPNINADALQQYLASKEIYVGLGASACAANHDYRVLEAFGVSKEEAEHTIRVSFGEESKVEDVGVLVEGIKKFKEMFV